MSLSCLKDLVVFILKEMKIGIKCFKSDTFRSPKLARSGSQPHWLISEPGSCTVNVSEYTWTMFFTAITHTWSGFNWKKKKHFIKSITPWSISKWLLDQELTTANVYQVYIPLSHCNHLKHTLEAMHGWSGILGRTIIILERLCSSQYRELPDYYEHVENAVLQKIFMPLVPYWFELQWISISHFNQYLGNHK